MYDAIIEEKTAVAVSTPISFLQRHSLFLALLIFFLRDDLFLVKPSSPTPDKEKRWQRGLDPARREAHIDRQQRDAYRLKRERAELLGWLAANRDQQPLSLMSRAAAKLPWLAEEMGRVSFSFSALMEGAQRWMDEAISTANIPFVEDVDIFNESAWPITEITSDFDQTSSLTKRFATPQCVVDSYHEQQRDLLARDAALRREAGEELSEHPLFQNLRRKSVSSDIADQSDRQVFLDCEKTMWAGEEAVRHPQLVGKDQKHNQPLHQWLKCTVDQGLAVQEVYDDLQLSFDSQREITLLLQKRRDEAATPMDIDILWNREESREDFFKEFCAPRLHEEMVASGQRLADDPKLFDHYRAMGGQISSPTKQEAVLHLLGFFEKSPKWLEIEDSLKTEFDSLFPSLTLRDIKARLCDEIAAKIRDEFDQVAKSKPHEVEAVGNFSEQQLVDVLSLSHEDLEFLDLEPEDVLAIRTRMNTAQAVEKEAEDFDESDPEYWETWTPREPEKVSDRDAFSYGACSMDIRPAYRMAPDAAWQIQQIKDCQNMDDLSSIMNRIRKISTFNGDWAAWRTAQDAAHMRQRSFEFIGPLRPVA